MPPQAARQDWLRHAWLLPAALAAAAIWMLCWNAWGYGYNPHWLRSHVGWTPLLGTDKELTPTVTMLLLLTGLGAFWWPRRRDRLPISLIVVVVLVIVAAVLGTASYIPCRQAMSTSGVSFWVLQLFVGQPPQMIYQTLGGPGAHCNGTPPLALQLGQSTGLGATVIGAIAATSVLWRRPLQRLRSRFASDVTIFTGLTPLTLPLLRQLAAESRSPRHVVVIEPDEKNPLLEEVQFTGARVVVGQPDSPLILRPIITSWRGCALNRLYALSAKTADNDAVINEARQILRRFRPSQNRQPHLVTRIDDPRQADSWRSARGGRSAKWFEDALSPAETTARGLVAQVLHHRPRRLLVCGDGPLTVPILAELARRAWEQAELVAAAAAGGAGASDPAGQPGPARLSVGAVTLLDPEARYIRREFRASTPPAVLAALPEVDALQVSWQHDLLGRLDRMTHEQLATVAIIIIAEDPSEHGMHIAGRVARLHPKLPVFVLSDSGHAKGGAIFDLLHPFETSLLVNLQVPEDTWSRIARHWHECYRLSHPVPAGHPGASTRVPWAGLGPFVQQENILQLRSILTEVEQLGRRWAPAQLVAEGSIVELSAAELDQTARAEHRRWLRRQVAIGRTGEHVVAWERLPPERRSGEIAHLRSQLSQLEAVGFVPTIPAGGPPAAQRFERVGVVRAQRLNAPLNWTNHIGEVLSGQSGDWRVIDEADTLRTVSDSDFVSSYAPTGDGTWRRVGTYVAWQVSEATVVRTKEGKATALTGDWIVEAPRGERWPVNDEQFQRTYRCLDAAVMVPSQRSAPPVTS